ncbi:MAG: FAD-binding protein [Elusimicrobia bacterium]|nr:FAD-binding protein [Elusimicrobiota bacterium]
MTSKVEAQALGLLRAIVGDRYVLASKEDTQPYASDATEHFVFYPEVVVKPRTAGEVSQILKLAREARIPVTPRGGGTGLSGGALPVFGGILLSLERMSSILEIDRENLMAVVEPGVVTETFQNEVEKIGLYYPPDPASRGSCLIGGNVAENAGGPHAVKYGVTKDYVLGLEAVLPDGEIIQTGGKLLKDVAGYSLTQLLAGSEGTLAVITRIILKLIPLPRRRYVLYAPFPRLDSAAEALTRLFSEGISPSACEFMEKSAMDIVEKKLGRHFPSRGQAEACLLIELDGNDQGFLDAQAGQTGAILQEYRALDVLFCDSPQKQQEIWNLRRSMGEVVNQLVYKGVDVVVPRTMLSRLLASLREISKKYAVTSACWGHVGDGNIHVNLIKEGLSQEQWDQIVPSAVQEIFSETVRLGGSITAEHGVGFIHKKYLPMRLGQAEIRLMRRIKGVFDPDNILNPGKIFPDYSA